MEQGKQIRRFAATIWLLAAQIGLDPADVSRATVTIDAIGCQTALAEKNVEKDADYCFALKRNQPILYEEVQLYFAHLPAEQSKVTRENGHGRLETRAYF